MLCPKCNSQSVHVKNGTKICGVTGCTYADFHPISYDNDVRQFEGEKGPDQRFSKFYSGIMQNGGISVSKEANFDKQFKEGSKLIADHCYLYKLSPKIQSQAEARFASILRLKLAQKREAQEQKAEEKKAKQGKQTQQAPTKTKNDVKFSGVKNYAAYALYSACFQNQRYFEDFNIYHDMLRITRDAWGALVKEIQPQIQKKIDFCPNQKAWHYVLRVCLERGVNKIQTDAMIEMSTRVSELLVQANRRSTVACCVFWQICHYSSTYKDKKQFTQLSELCLKTAKQKYNLDEYEEQKYFNCTVETVKGFFQKIVEANLVKFMPRFKGSTFNYPEKK